MHQDSQEERAQAKPRWRLIEERTAQGWSQFELAARIGTTDVSVSRWERGLTKPGPYYSRKLCALFGKDEEDLGLTGLPVPTERGPVPAHRAELAPPPPQAFPLVGREPVLDRLKQEVCTPGPKRFTALIGLPGIGKSALAVALAHDAEVRARFLENVIWIVLGPHPDARRQLIAWGNRVGLSLETTVGPEEPLMSYGDVIRKTIGPGPLLVIIDDVWRTEDALTFELGGSEVYYLVTTRFPSVAYALDVHRGIWVQELSGEEGLSLMSRLAPAAVDLRWEAIREIVRRVEGHPLALVLIGTYLAKLAGGMRQHRLEDALKRVRLLAFRSLLKFPHGLAGQHAFPGADSPQSLSSVFMRSLCHLEPDEWGGLVALSSLPPKPAGFSEDLALSRCSLGILDMLCDMGLVESPASGQYGLHPVLVDCVQCVLRGHVEDTACPVCGRSPFTGGSAVREVKFV